MARHSDQQKRHALARLRENDGNISRTSDETGIPKSTLSLWGRQAGVQATARATSKARTEDTARRAQEMREELRIGLLEDARRLREQLFVPTEYLNWNKDGVPSTYVMDEPSHQDKRHIAGAVRMLVTTSMDVERHGRGGDAGVGLIADLINGIHASLVDGGAGE